MSTWIIFCNINSQTILFRGARMGVNHFFSALAISVLFLHALFILWVIFGTLLTGSRSILRWLHIVSLVWGMLTELLVWPCPLTALENSLEAPPGVQPDNGWFLLHYLVLLGYPGSLAP